MRVLLTYLCLSLLVTCALGNWRLVWNDEFDTIDPTKWNIRNMLGNIGNGEKQWYSPDSLSIFNNTLRITASKENYGGQGYKSGRLDTQDKAFFTYGRYESRARFSGGKGMWPAIWLLSQDKCWAVGSEVDIAEYRAVKSTELGVYYHYSNRCCYKFENCINTRGGLAKNFPDLSLDFHIYSFEWWPTNMTWFVDGWKIFEIQIPRQLSYPDLSPHYWILNSAIGGHYAEDPDQNTKFPNYFDIDYVRNYVWKPKCEINDCSGRGCCDPKTVTCKCDPGWAGYNCEYDLRTYVNDFYDITNNDNRPHGWGNKDTTYLDKNTVRLNNGGLKMTLTNSGCAIGNCGGTKYSSGGWESVQRFSYGSFTVTGRASNIPGTAFNIGIAGAMLETGTLEQIAFTILGNETNKVRLYSYSSDYTFLHRTIDVSANLASNYYTYRIDYFPSYMVYYINNVLLLNTTQVMPKASRLGLGVYYTANTDWYGRFSYSSPSSVYISKATWTISASPKATCL